MSRTVDHPQRYGGESSPQEAIKVIEAHGLGFHLGNVIKYVLRADRKGSPLEDLKKSTLVFGPGNSEPREGSMMVQIVPATELFNSDDLVALENVVCNLPPSRKIYDQKREYPRFIDLPPALDERARLPYDGVRRVEYDIDDEAVRLYF